jgi:mannose-6-phosphate isomerase-like protein (cupin superfamily)
MVDLDHGLEIIHHEADGLYTKEIRLPAGVAFGKHIHQYSHQSFLGKGKVKLIRGDREDIIEAPACILVEAGVEHAIFALTDTVWFCTHNTDRADADELYKVTAAD